jgi:hypothetical protein
MYMMNLRSLLLMDLLREIPKPSPQAVDDAARTIQREEAKICGVNLPGGCPL